MTPTCRRRLSAASQRPPPSSRGLSVRAASQPTRARREASDAGPLPVELQLGQRMIKTATIELEIRRRRRGRRQGLPAGRTKTAAPSPARAPRPTRRASPHSSRLEVKVPVAEFDRRRRRRSRPSVGTRSTPTPRTSTSPARSPTSTRGSRAQQESIDQLRQLFSRATKLGDIITLERELSQREADLEALQAQQRSLAAQTTMSTITVSVSWPTTARRPEEAMTTRRDSSPASSRAGTASSRSSSAPPTPLGLVLPLGALALVLGWLAWIVVRRWPRRGRLADRRQPTRPTRRRAAQSTECTSSTSRASTSGSVAGSTPWPRLKM